MSNVGLPMAPETSTPRGPRGRGRSFIAVVLAIGVLLAIGYGVKLVVGLIPDFGRGPEDFVGEGTEPVAVVVIQGQTLAQIGNTLKDEGVVASVEAWLDAAKAEPAAGSIAPGTYDMRLQMSADAAVSRMVDPSARITDRLLLREGLRIWETLEKTAEVTGLSMAKLERAAANADAIGLPKYAKGNAEGFLFPATYELDEGETAREVLSRMVGRWEEAAADVDLVAGAKKLGWSPYEIMIIASLVQSEGHPDDFAKVARVIYNRLDEDTWGGTYGYLQLDATVNYALKSSEINLSEKKIQKTDSKYNTYLYPGLPPTPINSPGEDAMAAALNPAEGPWLWYVTVNPESGETKFTDDYDEFLTFRSELSAWYEKNG